MKLEKAHNFNLSDKLVKSELATTVTLNSLSSFFFQSKGNSILKTKTLVDCCLLFCAAVISFDLLLPQVAVRGQEDCLLLLQQGDCEGSFLVMSPSSFRDRLLGCFVFPEQSHSIHHPLFSFNQKAIQFLRQKYLLTVACFLCCCCFF